VFTAGTDNPVCLCVKTQQSQSTTHTEQQQQQRHQHHPAAGRQQSENVFYEFLKFVKIRNFLEV